MVDGKMKIAPRRDRAEWKHSGIMMDRPTWGADQLLAEYTAERAHKIVRVGKQYGGCE